MIRIERANEVAPGVFEFSIPSLPPDQLPGPKRGQLELTGTVEPDGRGRVGAIRILVESVDRRGRSSASLPDGTILVGSSRQPFLDAARVLIASGYDPDSWLESWRPGATTFALRGRLRIAAALTVDETKTAFAKWKAFSSSAVSSSIQYSEEAATTVAPAPSALPQLPPEKQSKKAETEPGAAQAASSVAEECAARAGAARGTCRPDDSFEALTPERASLGPLDDAMPAVDAIFEQLFPESKSTPEKTRTTRARSRKP